MAHTIASERHQAHDEQWPSPCRSAKGNLYYLAYASTTASFQSNVSQFFTPMQQSFQFLT